MFWEIGGEEINPLFIRSSLFSRKLSLFALAGLLTCALL